MDCLWVPVKSFNPKEFIILVVDDLTSNLKVVGAILDRVGYCTTFATSGQQALDRVQNSAPDLILLDIMMPEMNGLEVCQKLKSDVHCRDIPIIFLTARTEQKIIIEAFERGAVDYITKPFNPAELLARVKIHLELKHTRDELTKTLVELNKLATTDPLTGVPNRRHLFTLAEQEFRRVCRYSSPLSVLMIDVDHFKQVNDRYGHAIGDETLKAIAQNTQKLLRNVDFFGRFGGEEFVAFLPETQTNSAQKVAERIRTTIANLSLKFSQGEAQNVKITVSIGLATYQPGDLTIDDILKRADEALYEAKDRGRNKVFVYESSSEYLSKVPKLLQDI